MLTNLERCAGTSAGSLVAAMMAVGYDAQGIRELMLSMDFNKFKNGWNPIRIFTQYGLYSGNYILEFVNAFMKGSKYKFSEKTTFKDLKNMGCKDLFVFTCNVNSQESVELSYEKTPDTIVAEAIRASMSIPFFFKAFQFSNSIPDNHMHVDGGIVYNYPLSLFDHPRFTSQDINSESLGLYLYAKPNQPVDDLGPNSHMFFSKQLFESMMDAQDVLIQEDLQIIKRSVMIDDLHYPATDFGLTKEDKERLIESGKQGALDYLNKNETIK